MADRYINLKELLPLYLQAYKELAAPMDAETPEFQIIEPNPKRANSSHSLPAREAGSSSR